MTRSRLRLGSCPDSWGVWFADDPRQTPWRRFFDELAEAGYRWLELGHELEEFAQAEGESEEARALRNAAHVLEEEAKG